VLLLLPGLLVLIPVSLFFGLLPTYMNQEGGITNASACMLYGPLGDALLGALVGLLIGFIILLRRAMLHRPQR